MGRPKRGLPALRTRCMARPTLPYPFSRHWSHPVGNNLEGLYGRADDLWSPNLWLCRCAAFIAPSGSAPYIYWYQVCNIFTIYWCMFAGDRRAQVLWVSSCSSVNSTGVDGAETQTNAYLRAPPPGLDIRRTAMVEHGRRGKQAQPCRTAPVARRNCVHVHPTKLYSRQGVQRAWRGRMSAMHGRSRMTMDPRIPTVPGPSVSSFHRSGRHCLRQA